MDAEMHSGSIVTGNLKLGSTCQYMAAILHFYLFLENIYGIGTIQVIL